MNNDNLKRVHKTLLDAGYTPPTYEEFEKDMQDDNNLQNVYNTLKKEGYTPPEYKQFKSDMGFGEVKPVSQPQQDEDFSMTESELGGNTAKQPTITNQGAGNAIGEASPNTAGANEPMATTRPPQPQQPTVQAGKVESVVKAEDRDGVKLRYYEEGGKRIYNPDDVAKWQASLNISANDEQLPMGVTRWQWENQFTEEQRNEARRRMQEQAKMQGAVTGVASTSNIDGMNVAKSAGEWEGAVSRRQKVENQNAWMASGGTEAQTAKQQQIQAQQAAVDALPDAMTSLKELEQAGVDANLSVQFNPETGQMEKTASMAGVEVTDENGNKYTVDEEGNIFNSPEEKEAYEYQKAQENIRNAKYARALDAQNAYRSTHEAPMAEPDPRYYENKQDYAQAKAWWEEIMNSQSFPEPIDGESRDDYLLRVENYMERVKQSYEQRMSDAPSAALTGWITSPAEAMMAAQNPEAYFKETKGDIRREYAEWAEQMRTDFPELFDTKTNEAMEILYNPVLRLGRSTAELIANSLEVIGENAVSDKLHEMVNASVEREQKRIVTNGIASLWDKHGGIISASAMGGAGMPLIIMTGAGDQALQARVNGASAVGATAAGISNALIWTMASKFVGTPLTEKVFNGIAKVQSTRAMKYIQDVIAGGDKKAAANLQSAMKDFTSNIIGVKDIAGKTMQAAELKSLKARLLQIAAGTFHSTLDMSTASALCQFISLYDGEKIMKTDENGNVVEAEGLSEKLSEAGKNALTGFKEGAIDGALFGLFFGAFGHGGQMWRDYRNMKGVSKLTAEDVKTSSGQAYNPETDMLLGQTGKNGVVIVVGKSPKEGMLKCMLSNGEYVDVPATEFRLVKVVGKAAFNEALNAAVDEYYSGKLDELPKSDSKLYQSKVRYANALQKMQEVKDWTDEEAAALKGSYEEIGQALKDGRISEEHASLVEEYQQSMKDYKQILNAANERIKVVSDGERRKLEDISYDGKSAERGTIVEVEIRKNVPEEEEGHAGYILAGDYINEDGTIMVLDAVTGDKLMMGAGDVIVTRETSVNAEMIAKGEVIRQKIAAKLDGDVLDYLQEGADDFPVKIEGEVRYVRFVGRDEQGNIILQTPFGETIAEPLEAIKEQYKAAVTEEANYTHLTDREGKLAGVYAYDDRQQTTDNRQQTEEMAGETGGEASRDEKAGAYEPSATTIEPMPIVEVDGKMKPDWEAAEPKRAQEYIYKERGLSAEEADAFVDNSIEAAENEVAALGEKMPKMETDLDEYAEKKAAWQAEMDAAQKKVDYWKQVKQEQVNEKAAAEKEAFKEAVDEINLNANDNLNEEKLPEDLAESGENSTFALNKDDLYERYEREQDTVDTEGGLVRNEVSETILPDHWRGALHSFGRHLGRRIEILTAGSIKERFEEEYAGAQGWLSEDGKTIYLNADFVKNDEALRSFVLGHETTHVLKREMASTPKVWRAFVETVKGAMGDTFDRAFKETRERYDKHYKALGWKPLSDEKIEEEVCSDWAGEHMLTDEAAIRRVVEEAEKAGGNSKQLIDRVLAWIENALNSIRAAMSRGAKVTAQYESYLRAKEIWQSMYNIAAKKRMEGATPKTASVDDAVRASIPVNHNSPYLLKKADGSFVDPETGERLGFDHRFMGRGEGAQVHGWGSYFSVNDLRNYAKRNDYSFRSVRDIFDVEPVKDSNIRTGDKELDRKKAIFEAAYDLWDRHDIPYNYDYSPEDIRDIIDGDISRIKRWDEHLLSQGDLSLEQRSKIKEDEYRIGLYEYLRDHVKDFRDRHHYAVEIPDDTGTNYFEEDEPLTSVQLEMLRRQNSQEQAGLSGFLFYAEQYGDKYPFKSFLSDISYTMGYKEASGFLSRAGFTGIHYDGRRDGECYVIFNENDAKITDHVRFSLPERERTLMGVHNISEDKLKKAIKQGGLANPSMAVVDTKQGIHTQFGEISLIPKSSLIDTKKGRNAGTYAGDIWSPTYPSVSKFLTEQGDKHRMEIAKEVANGDKDMERHIASTIFDYVEGNGDRLHFLFLKQKGLDPQLRGERIKHSHEEYEAAKALLGDDFINERDFTEEQEKALLDLMTRTYEEKLREDAEKITDPEKRQKAIDALIKANRERFVDENGKLYFSYANSYLYDVWRDEEKRNNPRIDWYGTDVDASNRVAKEGLSEEYADWKDNLFDEGDVEEKLFDGYTPSGKRRYVPNTVENASKLMNKRSTTNAYDEGGLGATRSALLQRFTTLKDIREHKDMLRKDDEAKQIYENMSNELFDIIKQLSDMQKISDNPFSNIDYAEARLQEAITQRDPIGYLNREFGYSIDKNSDYASQLMNFISDVKAMPSKYFETKFKRPVGLDEFAVAVVPEDTSADVVDALKEAGLEVHTYAKDENDQHRTAAVMNAVSKRDDIMFSFAGIRGATNADKAEGVETRKQALGTAKQMEADGKSPLDTKIATGWERGKDGKWRYEMPDLKLHLSQYYTGTTKLSEIADAPELFAAYPSMQDIEVEVYDNPFTGTMGATSVKRVKDSNQFGMAKANIDKFPTYESYLSTLEARREKYLTQINEKERPEEYEDVKDVLDNAIASSKAEYDRWANLVEHADDIDKITISLNNAATRSANESVEKTLIHEVQHVIQEIEGFAKGGNVKSILNDEEVRNVFIKELQDRRGNAEAILEEAKQSGDEERIKVAQSIVDKWDSVAKDFMNGDVSAEKAFEMYQRIAGEVEARNAAERSGMTPEERRRSLAEDTEDYYRGEQIVTYGDTGESASIVAKDKADELEKEPKVKVYRAMQLRDGKLYPPMAGRINGEWQNPIELGVWEQADEHPELATNGKFKLDKGNGSTLNVAYNPYLHTSRSPLNDQFSSAWSRPELVTVEVEVPESELTSGYKADKAKDAVGEVDWKSGVVSSQLAKQGNPRKVILSRYDKPIRIVPTEEVAERIAEMLKGTDIEIPFNTVTPELREALEAQGVKIGEPQKGNAGAAAREAYEEWKNGNDVRFSVAESAKDILDKWENQDGSEEYPYMYNSDLVEMVDNNRELTKDDKVALMVYRYNQLMKEDFEEGRRDFSGGEADDLVENQLIPYLEELAKGSNDVRFSVGEDKPTFYSNAERAVEGIKQEKATPEQWLAMITKAGGLKAGEDKWMGLSDWLKGQDKKSLTKDEVLDFIRSNQIIVEDVNYSEYLDEAAERLYEYNNEFRELVERAPDIDEYIEIADTPEDWAFEMMVDTYGDDFRMAFEVDGGFLRPTEDIYGEPTEASNHFLGRGTNGERAANRTRLHYTTEGLNNKKEIALVVPGIESWNEKDEIHFGDAGEGRAIAWIRFGETTTNATGEFASRRIKDEIQNKYGGGYSLDMTDEDIAKDQFATYLARGEYADADVIVGDIKNMPFFGERASKIIPLFDKMVSDNEKGQRVLVIDEIQSNRHQAGRERGYKVSKEKADAEMNAFLDRMREKYNYNPQDKFADFFSKDELAELDRLNAQQHAAYFGNSDVPDAPFDKNWHELAMKRMLRYAAENGYDKIAWTKGEQQAERYNIGNVVDFINVAPYEAQSPNEVDGFDVDIQPKNGDTIRIFADKQGNISSGEYEGRTLADVLGKPLANKILASEANGTIEGDGLRIGAEGMAGFYDNILPRFMDKYGKKWGVKTGEVELPNVEEAGRKMWAVDITPEMKESVMQGQPMFSLRGKEEEPRDVKEVAAEVMSAGTMLWDDAEGRKGVKAETGYGEGEKKRLFGLFRSPEKGGKSVDEIAHEVMELCNDYGIKCNGTDEAKAAVLDVLSEAEKMSDIRNYTKNRRLAEADEQTRYEAEQAQAERDAHYLEQYGMTEEEYEDYLYRTTAEMMSGSLEDAKQIEALTSEKERLEKRLAEEKQKAGMGSPLVTFLNDQISGFKDEIERLKEESKTKLGEKQSTIDELRGRVQQLKQVRERRDSLAQKVRELKEENASVSKELEKKQRVVERLEKLEAELNNKNSLLNNKVFEAEMRSLEFANVKEELCRFIEKEFNAEWMPYLGKDGLNALLQEVKNARTPEQLEEARVKVQNISANGAVRFMQNKVGKLLKLQRQGVNGRNMNIAKNVDERTRNIFDNLFRTTQDMRVTDMDEDMTSMRRRQRELRGEIDYLERQKTGADAEDIARINQEIADKQAEQASLAEQMREMKDKIEEARHDNERRGIQGVDEAVQEMEKKMEDAAEGKYTWTDRDTDEMVELEVKQMMNEAQNYANDAERLKGEIDATDKEIHEDNKKAMEGGYLQTESYRQSRQQKLDDIKAKRQLMASAKMAQAEKLAEVENRLSDLISGGRNSLKYLVAKDIERKHEILRNAYADIKGESYTTKRGKTINDQDRVSSWLTNPLYSFEYMCQKIARNSRGKEGWFYNYFIKGENGVLAARDEKLRGLREQKKILNDKVNEIFGTKDGIFGTGAWIKLAEQSEKVEDHTGIYIETEDGGKEELPMSKGAAMYTYMVWKMNDGRVKLENQGFTEESIDEIRDFLGSKYLALADWLQEDFLTATREKYNEKYLQMYHTSMDKIENYVPLKINTEEIAEESDTEGLNGKAKKRNLDKKAGSLIKRTHNISSVDISKSAFDVISEHVEDMEDWYAYVQVRRDLDTILSSRHFRNQLNKNSAGDYARFKTAAGIATESADIPPATEGDRMASNLTKNIIGFNIAYRLNTALKQFLSAPAYLAYSTNPKFLGHLVKNAGKSVFWNNMKWCYDNLESFRERVSVGDIGDNRLSENEKLENTITRDKFYELCDRWSKDVQKANAIGMLPNRLVDAMTCSMGIKTIYDYEMGKAEDYVKKAGLNGEEAKAYMEKARQNALREADIFYNATQQSSHPAFLSEMQKSRNVLARAFSAYQNSNIAYTRMMIDGIRDLKKDVHFKKQMKQYVEKFKEEGMSESAAKREARTLMVKNYWEDLSQIGVPILLKSLWLAGGKGLLGFFTSDDDEEKTTGEKALDASTYALMPYQGMPAVNMAMNFVESAKNDWDWDANPILGFSELESLASDVIRAQKKYGLISPEVAGRVIYRLFRIGVADLQTISNILIGVEGLVNDGHEYNDWMVDVMYMLNTPKSGRKEAARYLAEGKAPFIAKGAESMEEYAERVMLADGYLKRHPKLSRWMSWMREMDKNGSVPKDEAKKLVEEYMKLQEEKNGQTTSHNTSTEEAEPQVTLDDAKTDSDKYKEEALKLQMKELKPYYDEYKKMLPKDDDEDYDEKMKQANKFKREHPEVGKYDSLNVVKKVIDRWSKKVKSGDANPENAIDSVRKELNTIKI